MHFTGKVSLTSTVRIRMNFSGSAAHDITQRRRPVRGQVQHFLHRPVLSAREKRDEAFEKSHKKSVQKLWRVLAV